MLEVGTKAPAFDGKLGIDKQMVLRQLQQAKEIYLILSNCTRMPFVMCDPETYDDEVFVYFDKNDADVKVKELNESGNPVNVTKIDNKMFLPIYSGLYPMGVNSIYVNSGKDSECPIQLEELVRRPDRKNLPKGQKVVENPALHLTALYFMQEFRKKVRTELTEELKEMQEELLAHYSNGTFLIAIKAEDKGIVVIKNQQGTSMLPIFTDMPEFHKFQLANPKEKFATGVIEANKIAGALPPEVSTVAINPMTTNIPLGVQKRVN